MTIPVLSLVPIGLLNVNDLILENQCWEERLESLVSI